MTTADASLEHLHRMAMEDDGYAAAHERNRFRTAIRAALFQLRTAARLTQAALAERAGWQQPYVARLEAGEGQFTSALIQLDRYARSCDAAAVVVFFNKDTGAVETTLTFADDARLKEQVAALSKAPAVESSVAEDISMATATVSRSMADLTEVHRRLDEAERRLRDSAGSAAEVDA